MPLWLGENEYGHRVIIVVAERRRDPTDVADRAGNSVEVLPKRYAKCLDGHRERNNRLIERALGIDGTDDDEQSAG